MRTFKIGGVHPQDNKQYSAHQAIKECPLPKQAIIPLVQHIGAPAQAVVEVGKKVKVGELLAKAGGFVSANICSPVSGTITKIGDWTDAWGAPGQAIYIDVEGDEWLPEIDRKPDLIHQCTLEPKEIIDKIAAAGSVGLGGRRIIKKKKLLPPPGKKAEGDHQLMMEHGEEIIIGIQILKKALGVQRAIIGIENNKPDAIAHMRELAEKQLGIEVMPLKLRYPQGGEKQLIDATIGRQVPSGALPIEVGAVVDNVATIYAVYEAVQKNKPLISRVMTVTGKSVKNPGNYCVRFGTPIEEVIALAGGVPVDTGKVIGGGPMMGRAMDHIEGMPANKRLSGLLFLPEAECIRPEQENCIRCGKCVQACPMGLEPYLLQRLSELEMWDELEKHDIMDCIDCGCCVFTCPAHRRLLDGIRPGKAKVGAILRERAAAAKK